ncbi:hypothetical protein C8R44DRAFT_754117 [Mycena epipterygia]|nr:hypothetical protein C8R44DRAFT_754117 [Mycena epipterygia]
MLKKTRRILGVSRTRVISTACSASDSHARRTYEDWYDYSRIPTYCGPLQLPDTPAGIQGHSSAAYDAAHGGSHLCAATVAHEATHHAAASTPASLRHICAPHRRKAEGSVPKHACPPHDVCTREASPLRKTPSASLPRRTPPRVLELTQHIEASSHDSWPNDDATSPCILASSLRRESLPALPSRVIPCTTLSSEARICGVPAHNGMRTRDSPRASYISQRSWGYHPCMSPRVARTPSMATRGTQPGRLVLLRPARTATPAPRMHRPQQSRRPPLRACTPSICARILRGRRGIDATQSDRRRWNVERKGYRWPVRAERWGEGD